MNLLKFVVVTFFAIASILQIAGSINVEGQAATQAPTVPCNLGSNNGPNGLVSAPIFSADEAIFRKDYEVSDGLGPCYNAQSCSCCHGNSCPGGNSQVNNIQAGNLSGGVFTPHLGGTLIQERSIGWGMQDHLTPADNIVRFRMSPLVFGAGFVECIADSTLAAIQASQPPAIQGTIVQVPVLEAPGIFRTGRFGWKDIHGSLLSMCAAELRDQIGITNALIPTESACINGSALDTVADGEDPGSDLAALVEFIRATRAPQRGTITPAVLMGQSLFNSCGCAGCHVTTIVTAPPGTIINGGTFLIPPALGNKIINPFSDFLLHDINSGDTIPSPPPGTPEMVRTSPLWGLILRTRFMHDGLSFSLQAAIQRHGGQAAPSRSCFNNLLPGQKAQVIAFLNSL